MSPERRILHGALRHAGAYIASGAVALYAVGVVTSIGKLRASHIDVSQGFSQIPLERHLRTGVATMFSGTVLLMVLVLAVILAGLSVSYTRATRPAPGDAVADAAPDDAEAPAGTEGTAATQPERSADPAATRQPSNALATAKRGLFAIGVVVVLLILPWTVLLFVPGWLLLVLPVLRRKNLSPLKLMQAYVLACVLSTLLTAFVEAFAMSDPLPYATVRTGTGRVAGPLIAINDGVVYLGAQRRDDLFQSVPTSKVDRLTVERRRRIQDKSVLQMLGWDFPRRRCDNVELSAAGT